MQKSCYSSDLLKDNSAHTLTPLNSQISLQPLLSFSSIQPTN